MAYSFVFVVTMFVLSQSQALQDLMIELPEACRGKTFCNIQPSNYPQDYFDKYMMEMQNQDFMMVPHRSEPPSERIIRDTINCEARVTVTKPYAINLNNETKLIIQTKTFEQTIEQTECRRTNATCFENVLTPEYSGTCKATFGLIKLYVFNPYTLGVEHVDVPYPMCCSCWIRRKMTKD